MPYKMNAQSFARCETNKAFINVQRMHDGGRTKSLHDAATQMTAIRHPATLPLPQTGIALLFLVLGGEPALCGSCKDAPTPTTANARMRDSACPRFRTDAKPTEQARFDNPTPPHFHPLNEWGYYFWCGGWANTHRAGKARTPYKMNAQRLCTDAKPSKRS